MQAALTEQGVCPPFGSAGFEMLIESECLAGGAEHRQQGDREGIEQPQAIAPLRRVDAGLCHAHAKVRILCIAEAAFYAPALAVFLQQNPGLFVAEARRQTPRFFHVFGLNANNSSHQITLGGHRRAAENARASALANPVARHPGFAICGCDLDIPAETNDTNSRSCCFNNVRKGGDGLYNLRVALYVKCGFLELVHNFVHRF